VAFDEVPETGRHYDLVADERVRAGIAELAALRALPRLAATFDVTRHAGDGLRVVGQVSATVGQVCSVTLEPIDNEVEEAIDLVFRPNPVPAVFADEEHGQQQSQVEVGTDEGPEDLVNGTVDLGAIATEFLILGIDPYPRKEDAVFEPPTSGADDAGHPFAALAALKKEKGTR
jgi:hypothetical protein